MAELLLELLCEEIPARMQAAAADRLRAALSRELETDRVEAFVTPRRLVGVARDLPARQSDTEESRKGPRVGAPDAAVMAFARSLDLTVPELAVESLAKGEFHVAHWTRKGRPTAEVLAEKLPDLVHGFTWPKSMRWGSGPMRWVRPIRQVVCLFDGKPIELDIDAAVPCCARTVGHRLHAPEPFAVTGFADYKKKLRKARVILDWAERRARIEEKAGGLAAKQGLEVKPDPALLDELAGLVEWPEVLIGAMDADFMTLPPEVLTTAMRHHQKYLSLQTPAGALAPRFVMVADVKPRDRGRRIVAGNERVLRARLADARFFWDTDRKQSLAARAPRLKDIVFHAKLGTLDEKIDRVQALAAEIAGHVAGADKDRARSAARLCKADLTTEMVGEFPELQGVMGRYYALAEGEHAEVAEAIAEHYAPRGPDDRCPTAPLSIALALADKIDSLVGLFALDERPTGSKDPYALRRAALGVIRLILENGVRLGLVALFRHSRALFPPLEGAINPNPATASLLDFVVDRLKSHLRTQGVRHDLIEAVFAQGEDDLVLLLRRVEALKRFLDTDDGANLLTAYQRAANIVRIEERKDETTYDSGAVRMHFRQPEEGELYDRLVEIAQASASGLADEDTLAAVMSLSSLRGPVDRFFDRVTVNTDEPAVRENRLRLLARVRETMDTVADFSRIEG